MAAFGKRGLVGHDDHRHAVIMQFVEEVEQRAFRRRVEISRRFVRQHDGWFRHQSTCDRDSLLLASRQFARTVGDPIAEADLVQGFECTLSSDRSWNSLIEQRDADVLHDVQFADQIEGLEDEADLSTSDRTEFLVWKCGDIDAFQQVRPAGGRVQASKQVHQGRFSGTGGAHDGQVLPLGNIQIDPSEGVDENRPIRFEIGLLQSFERGDVLVHRNALIE